MRSSMNRIDAIVPLSPLSILTSSNGHGETETNGRFRLSNSFLIYFNFMYYLGGCPFRLVKEPTTGYYQIQTWRPQQVICAFLNILSLFRLTAAIRSAYPDDPNSILFTNPTTYFDIVRNVVSLLHKLALFKMFWWDKKKYQSVVNVIVDEEPNLPNRKGMITHPYFSCILFSVNVLKMASCLIGGCYYLSPIWAWSPAWWLRRLVAQSRFAIDFGLQPPSNKAPNLDRITFHDGAIALLMLLSDYQRQLSGLFADLLVFVSALTLWVTASSFAEIIEGSLLELEDENDLRQNRPEREEWIGLHKMFRSIEKLSSTINSALGDQVTLCMADAVIYFSVKLNAIFMDMDWYRRIMLIVYYTQIYALLYISAEICEKMKALKHWLLQRDHMKHVPLDEANLVLHEICISREIGLKGSSSVTLTYPFVGSFINAVLTFFVICYQESG